MCLHEIINMLLDLSLIRYYYKHFFEPITKKFYGKSKKIVVYSSKYFSKCSQQKFVFTLL